MAGVATAAYSADALTSGAADGSQWDYAVPIGYEEIPQSKPRSSHDSNSIRARSSRNRNSNGSRSSSVSRNVHAHDSYMASGRGRRDHSLNRHGSEVGSMREAYGHEQSARREHGESKDGSVVPPGQETNQENWIHRDKLAKIESEELHQAAILFQRRIRAESKSSAGHGRNHDSQHSATNGGGSTTSPTAEHSEPWPELREEAKADGANDEDDERKHWDLRRPEEIAADEAASSIYSHPGLRKSSSRIPISTASPAPLVPSVGRDSRGPRSRAATDENDESQAPRGRRASEPIAVETESSTPSPESRPGSRGANTTPNTPAKKTPAKATGSANRKTSAPPTNRKTTARSRAVSGNNSSQRPTTRSGESRPTTAANRPEGDPPWLATMYKPDPRLPPDQQMLPTLAKKMQQEQWEKEGRTPTTYDRDFAPLAVHPQDAPPVPAKTEEPIEPLKPEEEPPKPPKSPEPPRPNTSTGYSTMPKVQDTPPLGLGVNPNWNPPVVSAPESIKKEKGCGCCIVM
ncbi:hypothetical protein NUU61_009080 [Penicillium alfredii]|uniref:TeaA receptor TeaR n=1 Tax=Penicillium alfredii TaxID=1506179 RepID=A0A9W9EMG4_9EURO|nr:uncharacterized protein NUU61_009080 [Penicillium alfredii]KAJ5084501.1 hypothetical protein NUU61_009080 [Penicillium alfredii]